MNGIARLTFAVVLLAPIARAGAQDSSSLRAALALEEAFVEAVEQAEPSVVAVMIDRAGPDPRALSFNPRLRGNVIIGERAILGLERGMAQGNTDQVRNPEWVPLGFGTGVVVDEQGLVLTNYHVVDLEDSDPPAARLAQDWVIYVVLGDGRVFTAQIFAADPRSDLAVLRLIAEPAQPITQQPAIPNLRPIRFGDAAEAKKGQFVLALGNPFAVARDGSPSVSWGIISNIRRKAEPLQIDGQPERPTLHHYGTLLQTDARLNLGTSGGALVNLRGEMIGLTTSLAAMSGYEQSAGYAIPIDSTMRRIIETLMQGREVEYGFLGINLGPFGQGDEPSGVVVGWAVPGTPASWSGLQAGDVIQEINSRPVMSNDDLVLTVGTLPAGTEVQVRVNRDGRQMTIPVQLAKFPFPEPEREKIVAAVRPEPWRGLRVDYPTAWHELLSTAGHGLGETPLPSGGCVLVTEVQPDSPAAQAGVKQGDLITQIAGHPVRTPTEFYEAAKKVSDRPVALQRAQGDAVSVSVDSS